MSPVSHFPHFPASMEIMPSLRQLGIMLYSVRTAGIPRMDPLASKPNNLRFFSFATHDDNPNVFVGGLYVIE